MMIKVLHAGLTLNAVGHVLVHFSLTSIAEIITISDEIHIWFGLDSRVEQDGECVCRIDHQQYKYIHILGDVIELLVTIASPPYPLQDNHEEEEDVDEDDAGQGGQRTIADDQEGRGTLPAVAHRIVTLQRVVEVLLGSILGQTLAHSIITSAPTSKAVRFLQYSYNILLLHFLTCPSASISSILKITLRIILTTMSRNSPNFIQCHLI